MVDMDALAAEFTSRNITAVYDCDGTLHIPLNMEVWRSDFTGKSRLSFQVAYDDDGPFLCITAYIATVFPLHPNFTVVRNTVDSLNMQIGPKIVFNPYSGHTHISTYNFIGGATVDFDFVQQLITLTARSIDVTIYPIIKHAIDVGKIHPKIQNVEHSPVAFG